MLGVLYAPLLVMAVFSFNRSPNSVRWTGFTFDWYERLWQNHSLRTSLENTLRIALPSVLLACLFGTLAALAARSAFRGRAAFATLVSLPVMVPDIVLAVSLLVLYRWLGIGLSTLTAIIAHTTFNLAYVAIVVSSRLQTLDASLEPAAQDLGCTPWGAFWRVTFPALRPALLSGALLAFTLSFDDFVVTYFTTGPGDTTLPVRIYSMVRFNVTPEIHALSTLMLAGSALLVTVALRIARIPIAGGAR
jgi:spermidine/putrescine transport system permease protein